MCYDIGMQEIIDEFLKVQDKGYQTFIQTLVPVEMQTIGVRATHFAPIAKLVIAKKMTTLFMQSLPHTYYEENILHATMFSRLKNLSFSQALTLLEEFLPYIDNWAVCDTCVSNFRKFALQEPMLFLKAIQAYLQSNKPYIVRFGLVSLLSFYLNAHFTPTLFAFTTPIQSEHYYVNMALAWFYSMSLVKQYDATIALLEQHTLSKWVHNKTIQKAIESFKMPIEKKDYLKTLRRK